MFIVSTFYQSLCVKLKLSSATNLQCVKSKLTSIVLNLSFNQHLLHRCSYKLSPMKNMTPLSSPSLGSCGMRPISPILKKALVSVNPKNLIGATELPLSTTIYMYFYLRNIHELSFNWYIRSTICFTIGHVFSFSQVWKSPKQPTLFVLGHEDNKLYKLMSSWK